MNFFWKRRKEEYYNSGSDDEIDDILALKMAKDKSNRNRASGSGSGAIVPKKIIDRSLLQGHERLFNDYFSETPVYNAEMFRRRFRMSRDLFLRIQASVESHEPYFEQKRNAAGKLGLSSLQKITAALRMLAYGVPADAVDEYIRIGESTAIKSLKKFVSAIISIFGDEYLRSPNIDDLNRLLEVGRLRGFPGMIGSIDCMHWKWKNCPTAWKGMFSGHVHDPTIILEAVASYDLWIWHAFFGLPGSHNDINVLERSSVFSELTQGHAPAVEYNINGHDYTMGYYLADGIYPSWATFVKTIPRPMTNKLKNFARCQESVRKDVERAFGVLQARFAIVRGPARFMEQRTLKDVMIACIILHNMIVESERHLHSYPDISLYDQANGGPPPVQLSREYVPEVLEFIQRHRNIRDREVHSQLQQDLIEHLWSIHSEE